MRHRVRRVRVLHRVHRARAHRDRLRDRRGRTDAASWPGWGEAFRSWPEALPPGPPHQHVRRAGAGLAACPAWTRTGCCRDVRRACGVRDEDHRASVQHPWCRPTQRGPRPGQELPGSRYLMSVPTVRVRELPGQPVLEQLQRARVPARVRLAVRAWVRVCGSGPSWAQQGWQQPRRLPPRAPGWPCRKARGQQIPAVPLLPSWGQNELPSWRPARAGLLRAPR